MIECYIRRNLVWPRAELTAIRASLTITICRKISLETQTTAGRRGDTYTVSHILRHPPHYVVKMFSLLLQPPLVLSYRPNRYRPRHKLSLPLAWYFWVITIFDHRREPPTSHNTYYHSKKRRHWRWSSRSRTHQVQLRALQFSCLHLENALQSQKRTS